MYCYSSVCPNVLFSRETKPWLGCGCLANHLQKLHPAYRSNISVLILKTTRWHRLLRKHSFQLSRIFLLSSYILDIYKEHLLSVHLKEPSKRTHRTQIQLRKITRKRYLQSKCQPRENKRYFCTSKSLELLFFPPPKLKNTVEKHDPRQNKSSWYILQIHPH